MRRRPIVTLAASCSAALLVTGCGGDAAVNAEGEAATTPDVAEYDDDRGVLLRGGYLAEPPGEARVWPGGQ